MFGKKQNTAIDFSMNSDIRPQDQKGSSKKEQKPVYTMPEKFLKTPAAVYAQPQKKKNVFLWTGIVCALALIFAAIIVFFMQTAQQAESTAAQTGEPSAEIPDQESVTGLGDITEVDTGNTNEDDSDTGQGTSIDLDVDDTLEQNINAELFGDTNDDVDTPLEAQGSITTPVVDHSDVPDASDKDRDKLTDIEEELYGTKNHLPDSDRDGYVDGVEVPQLYSPVLANEDLLASGLVIEYENQSAGWRVYYPATWLVEPVDATKQQVLFTSQSEEGDFFEIAVEKNTNQYTAQEWYDTLVADVVDDTDVIVGDDLTPVTIQGVDGLVSEDGLVYYFATETQLIRMMYTIGLQEEIAFRTTFEMMVNSLQFTKTSSPDQSEIQSSGNRNTSVSATKTDEAEKEQTNETEEEDEQEDLPPSDDDEDSTGGLNELL